MHVVRKQLQRRNDIYMSPKIWSAHTVDNNPILVIDFTRPVQGVSFLDGGVQVFICFVNNSNYKLKMSTREVSEEIESNTCYCSFAS